MLAVLHVAHSRQVSEGKIARLRLEPDLRIHLVRPGSRLDSSLDGVLRAPVWRRADPHRCLYGTLTFGLRRFRPDILHVEEEPDSLAALQVCLARRTCAPAARLVFHTWQNVARERGPGVRAVLRTTLGAATAVLCATPEAERVARQLGFRGPTRAILPQGVDPVRFAPTAVPPPPGRFTVGYVGRLAPEKGCDLLVEAAAALGPPCSLTIVGHGPERATLERRASERRASDRVRFLGPVDHASLPGHLSGFDVLVLPSRTTATWKEQFGRVLAEAMACQVPVVGSDSGAIPWVIGDAGLVFPEGDAAGLADRLRTLRDDRTLRLELGRRGRARAVREFAEDRLGEQTAAFYRELVPCGASADEGARQEPTPRDGTDRQRGPEAGGPG